MAQDSIKHGNVFKLLKQTTSLPIVCSFLKSKGLHHSAQSWDKLYDVRIAPYLASGELKIQDFIDLLRDIEEYGRQHTFLFNCSETLAGKIINRQHLEKILIKTGYEDLSETPKILDEPQEPTIVDIRIDGNEGNSCLVIKIVDRRTRYKFVGDELMGNIFVKNFEVVHERAVNIFKLRSNGLLEIRVASNGSISDYLKEISKLQKLVSGFIPLECFSPHSLYKAKQKIWKKKETLKSVIKYSDFTFRNDQGTVLRAASGSGEDNLFDDKGAISGITEFINHDGYCDRSSIWFLANETSGLSREVNVSLAGELNEFAIGANCTRVEYDYVFSQLTSLNR